MCEPKHAGTAEIVNRLDTFTFTAELSPSVRQRVILRPMQMTLVEIFRDSETHHRLSLFDLADLKTIEARLFEKNGKPYLKCLATDKDRPAKPEEIVRQLWIHKLINQYGYPKARLAIEHPVAFGSETKRADIVVFDKERVTVPYIMVELKKTKAERR